MRPRVGAPGERVGVYVLVKHLGSGGNADVWQADGPAGPVALKLLRTRNFGSEPYQRFVREVIQLRGLGTFPGVLPLLDAHLPTAGSRDRAWLVMPLAVPLRTALSSDESIDGVVGAVAEVGQTLAGLAERGVAHRDVKPDNLYDFEERAVIGDFGLIDAPGVAPLTVPGASVGPVHFSAPEMVLDAAAADGFAADVYSLGKTLWVLLTRQNFPPPGEHRPGDPLFSIATYLAHPRTPTLDALIARMTRGSPLERPVMADVVAELRAWLRQPAVSSPDYVDLSDIAKRVAAASGGRRAEQAEFERRVTLVRDTLDDFADAAEPIARYITDAGLATFGKGGFETDASDLLSEVVGRWPRRP